MHLVLWNAARRLAFLVVGSLGLVAAPFVVDARVGAVPAVTATVAVALLVIALFPIVRARRFVRRAAEPAPATPAAAVYRTSARVGVDHEADESGAAREAAIAFLLLAVSGALVVVAAAAR
jgi:hypothetical protein